MPEKKKWSSIQNEKNEIYYKKKNDASIQN